MNELVLISHHLCPYVQRVAIALSEKQVPFERIYIDLANKPSWFLELSPLGKTPVLKVGTEAVFESAAILEFLEETQPRPLHPTVPLLRAQHRGWIEFSSVLLSDIAGLYSTEEESDLAVRAHKIAGRLQAVEARLAMGSGPWFDGDAFSLVDAAFAPVFRYFEVFDRLKSWQVFNDLPRTTRWKRSLATRTSVINAVSSDYRERLMKFLQRRDSAMGRIARAA